MDKIFEFIGLDYGTWLNGFEYLSEIFQYVVSSTYFDPDVFAYENMNNIARVRDRKRATYSSFLEYIKPYGSTSKFKCKESKSEYLPQIFEFFPEAWEAYRSEVGKFNKYKELKTKFNGDLVREWTDLEGKELGKFMESFKRWVGTEDYYWIYIDERSQDTIKADVMWNLSLWG